MRRSVAAVYDRRKPASSSKACDAHRAPLQNAATKRFCSSTFILRPLRYNQRRLNSVLAQTQPGTTQSDRGLARSALAVAVLAALWFVLCKQLSGEWSVNEQYNYGWFVPFLALYLFWLRWEDRPAPEVRSQKLEVRSRLVAAIIGLAALLLLLPVRLFEIGTPEWRPLGWIHAASVAPLTLLYLSSAGGKPWLRHFAFPIAFFFVAVPWVTPIEVPIIQGLMRVVAAVAAETVTLFGIPAQLEGNLIRVTSGLVGVNEACSGVRSLQTALMIGLLFGELKRLSIWRCFMLVAGAVAIALTGNFCRAVFLVWIAATENISEVNRWHSLAGYTIVGLVFVGTLLLTALLGRKKTEVSGHWSVVRNQASSPFRDPQSAIRNSTFILPTSWLGLALCWIVAVELGAHLWYRAICRRRSRALRRWRRRNSRCASRVAQQRGSRRQNFTGAAAGSRVTAPGSLFATR